MNSRWRRTVIYVLLRLIRLSLDFISNIIFGIINYRKPEKIKPVTDPILLETAQSLAEKIRMRKLKSVDVIKAYITRIREVNPTLNIISDERFKDAVQDAEKADQFIESGKNSVKVLEDFYPYLGVPFTTKESISVKGMLNTAGLYSSKGRRASKDADTIALMKKAGGIPLAVTNVPELTMWWDTFNNVYGISRNPYDPRRTVGGSSGGEGALLGAGGSVIGIGSDVGGSIRIPSFVNGIFGLKPSKGIVSNIGQVPDNGHLYDEFLSTGPMCRYATDLLPMLKVLADKNVSKLRLDRKIDLSKIKIYYMDEAGHPFCTRVTSEMKQAQMKVIHYFEETYNIKAQKLSLRQMYYSADIFLANMATVPAKKFTTLMSGNGKDVNIFFELIKWCLRVSKHTLPCLIYAIVDKVNSSVPRERRNRFLAMTEELKKTLEDLLGEDGIFLYPPHPEAAIYVQQSVFKSHNFVYTGIFNALGLPVTSCPLGLNSRGLPLGVQIVGSLNNDLLTVSVAEELEKVFGGWRNPNL